MQFLILDLDSLKAPYIVVVTYFLCETSIVTSIMVRSLFESLIILEEPYYDTQ